MSNASFAGELTNSILYKYKATNCIHVDLKNWHHPTQKILNGRNTKLLSVELCNNKTYPIFHIESKYDPRTSATDSFFLEFYSNLAKANAWWSYALIDESDDVIIYVTTNKTDKSLQTDFEDF